MSFFNQKGDDSNLQYDDTAFLYFISSFISLGAVILFFLTLRDLMRLAFKDEYKLRKVQVFDQKIDNMKKLKRGQVLGKRLVIKIVGFVVLVLLFKVISDIASKSQNKLKGFDPYEILGVPKDASLRDIKKAYRKLALQYHPDKNIGNAQAQNKFILISKSYECFTDEKKKANCFKFGNPDGANTFRVGIGLPQFFLNVQYQFYVLPIVLTILLILVPWAMISWNNKIKILDHDGISYNSYNTFFRCFANKKDVIDQYTFLYIMTSFPELYEHQSCRPITKQDKQELQKLLSAVPNAKKSVYDDLNDNQLDLLWQIFSYTAKIADFRSQNLRQSVEYYIEKVANMILLFANRSPQGQEFYLLDNPEWKIYYIGFKIIHIYLQFEKDFYNRTLIIPRNDFLWIHNLDLDSTAKTAIVQAIGTKRISSNLSQIIRSPQKLQSLVEIVPQQSRKSLQNQLKAFPIYNIDLKMKVGNQQRTSLSHVDYAKFYFRIKRINQTLGYSLVNNYPYPRKDSVYILILEDSNPLFLNKISFPYKQDEFVQKIDYKTNRLGKHVISVIAFHETIFSAETVAQFQFKCTEMPKEQLEKPIQFHPDDINMEKLHKTFFQVLLELEKDPEENELSDSQGEEEEEVEQDQKKKGKRQNEHNHGHGHGHEGCNQCSDQSDQQIDD